MSTWYINADTGSDTAPGDGTVAHPYQTIAKAQTVDADGDTFYLYNATAHYTYSNSTLNSTYQGQSTGAIVDMISSANPSTFTSNKSTTFNDLKIVSSSSTFWNLRDLSGIAASWNRCIFTGVANTAGTPLFSNRNATNCSYTIKACLFNNLGGASASIFGRVSADSPSMTYNIYNNTFYFDGLTAMRVFIATGAAGETYNIKNNIFYNAIGATIINLVNPTNATTTYQYNDAFQMTVPPTGINNITTDPLFIDISLSNFNLRPTSPCIDTGILV